MEPSFICWDEYDDRPWTALPKVSRSFLSEIPVLTIEVPAQVGFILRMAEESVIDRIAQLEVEGHL